MTADFWYRGYGFAIRSEIALPELRPDASSAAPDIHISFDPGAARQWEASGAAEADGDDFFAAPAGGQVMRVAGIADYWVRAGRDIRLAPAAGTDAATVRLYLLGSALGMAFHQRGLLVLHGATVVRAPGRATVFVGDSGEGKSTLAARLGRDGHPILGDDTMPLRPGPAGFDAWPGSRTFKLWSDTLAALGEGPEGLDPVGDRLDKFFYPNAAGAADAPARVDEIVALASEAAGRGPALETLGPLEALRIVSTNTYRPEYVPLLGREAEHFRQCSKLAGSVSVLRLTRPRDMTRLDETVALLEAHWAGAPIAVQAG